MKRLIVGLLAAFLTVSGLVAFSPQPATAACPYTNCVATSLTTKGTRLNDNKASFKVTVKSAGNTWPRGRVELKITKRNTTRVIYTKVRRVVQASSNSSVIDIVTPTLPRGTYTLRFRYIPDSQTVFKASGQARRFESF